MKAFAIVVLTLMAFSVLPAQTHKKPMKKKTLLRYDGFYRAAGTVTPRGDTSWYYFRFYASKNLVSTNSFRGPEEIKSWFEYGNKGASSTSYSLIGDSLSFSVTNRIGTIDYTGRVLKNKLRLHSLSHINNNEKTAEYVFIKVD